ncbi:MAG: thioredoxin family protein [archaeon]|nr:thioredoxin family protein [archaeon]
MKNILALTLVAMAFFSGCIIPGFESADAMQNQDAMDKKDAMQDGSINAPAGNGDAMDSDATGKGDSMEGEAMAKNEYKRYSKAQFDATIAQGRPIMLEFYADWCPNCAQQKPVNEEAFAGGKMPQNSVGFFVHYKDTSENDEDRDAARMHGITYQHTRIFIDAQGNTVSKKTGYSSEEQLVAEMNKAAGI